MNKSESKNLLKLARDSISTKFNGTEPDVTNFKHLKENVGLFVTLHEEGELRGCIGYVEGIMPLYQAVVDLARAAAFSDPRFPPLQEGELENIVIEISVLTVPERLPGPPEKFPEQIKIGRDGLIIKGIGSGILLPQVATEQGWNPVEFLDWVCLKAGLPKEAWKDPSNSVLSFQSEIFSEG